MKTRLKEILQEKGMMSKTLAKKIGISEVSVSALANGKSNNLETLAKAARCLDVPIWQLFAAPADFCENRSCEIKSETKCPHCGKSITIIVS